MGGYETSRERRERHVEDGSWTDETVAERLVEHGDRRPDDVAVIDQLGSRRRSFGALVADARTLAAHLTDVGVGRGSVVSVQLPNSYEAVVAFAATQLLGAVVNPLLPNYRAKELAHVFRTAAPCAIVAPQVHRGFDHQALVDEVAATTGHGVHAVTLEDDGSIVGITARDAGTRREAEPITAEGLALSELIFTSGTEAQPKGILHSEQTANFSVRAAFDHLAMSGDDVVWMPSPVGHSTGLNYGVRMALYHGLPLLLQDQWDGEAAATLVAEHGATYTLAATTFLRDLTEVAARRGVRLPSLRKFGCGGAPVPPDLVRAAEGAGIGVLRLYGSTEVLVGTWHRPDDDLDRRAGSDGPALPGIEIEVRDDDGDPVEPGTPGELHLRGPDTCHGYFADPDRTAQTFLPDGWVRSGDVVTLDERGDVRVVGRKKEIIIRGGMNIAPREIEELLVALPGVVAAAVVGLPDERLGERCCACVVLGDGAELSFDDMVAGLRATGMATYKLPQALCIVDALPSTASGKVQKHVLLERIAAGQLDVRD